MVSVTLPDPDGAGPLTSQVTSYTYNGQGKVATITQPDPAYDNRSRLTSVTQPDPDGAGSLTAPVTTYAYDLYGDLMEVTAPGSRVTSYAYNGFSELLSVTEPDPDGAGSLAAPVTQFGYNVVGVRTSVTDPRGNVTNFAHDRLWRQTSVTQADPDGAGPLTSPVSSFVYDVASRLTSRTDPLNRVTSFGYDRMGRQTSVTQPDPDGAGPLTAPVTSYAYDAASNLTSVTDPLNHATTYAYDALNRRTSITDALSGVTSFAFDAIGNLKSLTDPRSNVTTWGYDNLNRAVSETNQLNFTRTFAYNAAGDLTSKVDRNGRKTTYEYDALHRQTAEKWRDGSDNVIRTISSTFDNSLDLTGVSDPAAAYTYVYDNLGRVTQQTQDIAGLTPDVILAQEFDAASNRLTLAATIGANLDFKNTYVYDNLNRLTQVKQDAQPGGEMGMPPYANAVAQKRVDFTYFADGQFNTISRYQSTGTSNAVAQTYHLYDGIGRLTDLDHKQSTTVLAGYDYVYDAASRITSINSTVEGLSTFTYDVTNQLIVADHATPRVDEAYTYDSNGNRTMSGYTTGTNNRTTSDGTYNYEYDNEGNMTKKTAISGGAYEEYTWDYRNRLTKITFKTSSHVVTATVDNTYDPFNRWVRRTYDSDGPGAAAATDQFFAHDGYNAILEFSGPNDTDLSHRYLWGPAVDQILADEQVTSLSSAGNVLWPLSDHLGTPRDIADFNEGTFVTSVTNHRTYNSFGIRTAETNAAVDLLIGFTGKAFDEVTKLQNNVNRLYDAVLGQWRSEDPIGFAAGDVNLRRYVENDPVLLSDPNGLWPWGRQGHHWVPQAVYNALKSYLSKDAIEVFTKGTLDPEFYDHGTDTWLKVRHKEDYNPAVQALLKRYHECLGKQGLLVKGKLTAEQAKRFLSFIRGGPGGLTTLEGLEKMSEFQVVRKWIKGFDQSVDLARWLKTLDPKLSPAKIKEIARKVINEGMPIAEAWPGMSASVAAFKKLSEKARAARWAKYAKGLGKGVAVLVVLNSAGKAIGGCGSTSDRVKGEPVYVRIWTEVGYDQFFGEEVEKYVFPVVKEGATLTGQAIGLQDISRGQRYPRIGGGVIIIIPPDKNGQGGRRIEIGPDDRPIE